MIVIWIFNLSISYKGIRRKPIFANETNYKVDINNLIRKVSKKTRVCFITKSKQSYGYLFKEKRNCRFKKQASIEMFIGNRLCLF